MSSPLSLGGSTEQVTTGRHAQHHPSQAAGALLSNHHHPVISQLWPEPAENIPVFTPSSWSTEAAPRGQAAGRAVACQEQAR